MEIFSFITLLILVILVVSKNILLKRKGIKVIQFGEMDKKDYLIPPFALFYFYLIVATVMNWPIIGSLLFDHSIIQIIGSLFCLAGIVLFIYALISLGKSFRVGLDEENPGDLVTTGAFSISRNPIYTAFALILIGNFLLIPNWIILIYTFAGIWLFNRQIKLEETSLQKVYGEKYVDYCQNVRRFL